ncbi:hypothetical protein FQZ97_1262950 [compost metagenome]
MAAQVVEQAGFRGQAIDLVQFIVEQELDHLLRHPVATVYFKGSPARPYAAFYSEMTCRSRASSTPGGNFRRLAMSAASTAWLTWVSQARAGCRRSMISSACGTSLWL